MDDFQDKPQGKDREHEEDMRDEAARPDLEGEAREAIDAELEEDALLQAEAEDAMVLESEDAADENAPQKKSLGREILEWVLVIVVAVCAALFIRHFIFEPVRVDGSSMLNTLHDNEYMIVTKYQYLFSDPERFDVVICRYPGRGTTNFVKRIVGVPGDTLSVVGDQLYVNGEPEDDFYIDYKINYPMSEVVIEEGHYFVMGDNRPHSNDSHAPGVGQLERNQIIGKVRFVAWPFSSMRMVK